MPGIVKNIVYILEIKRQGLNMYKRFGKRYFDVLLSVCLLTFAMPVLVTAFLLLYFVNKGKPFFLQKRPGKDGKPFFIIKFKTMNDVVDKYGNLLDDEKRLTSIGKIIRKSSIDELPQLINVLSGDMSIIGPRPLLMQYLKRYSPEQARRHEVKPGITGWAQVNGRNAISWEAKFKLDLWYVDNQNLLIDLKIIIMTILKVLRRDGINQDGEATMEEFFQKE